MNFSHDTAKVKLKNGIPTYAGREVILSDFSSRLLKGKGEGGQVEIFKHLIKYKPKNDRKNHQ